MNRCILVIDDEADILEIAKVSLQVTKQWDVLTATSGHEGIAIATAVHPDAILLDVMMPVRDGLQTLQELQVNPDTRTIPVLLLTTMAQSIIQQSYVDSGARAVLVKPFDPGALGTQIATVLNWSEA